MSDNDLDDELLALAEEEEDDASAPGSPESLGSGAMEESESEADAEGEDDDDDEGNPFPLEGKFKNDRDRTEIMAMTEVQREELLAERAAEQEHRLQDLQLRKLLEQREKDEAKKKRKAGAADLDDSNRKASRPKTKQSETLDHYKKVREQRGKELERQKQRGGRRRSRSDSGERQSHSDRDAEGEDEVDWDFSRRLGAAAKDDPPATVEDINSCRIGRTGFTEVCFYPGFEDAITGTYCRMNAGPRAPGSHEFIYRIMQIKGFAELPDKPYGPYVLEARNGKKYMTDQYVIGVEGKGEKKIQFNFCSDGRITEAEFDYYKNTLQSANMKLPVKSQLEKKYRDINKLRTMQFSNIQIQEKLKKQNKYVDRLIENATSKGTIKSKTPAQIKQERIEEINRQNRKLNQEEGRKAMVDERKKDLQRRAFAQKERERKEKENAEKLVRDAEKKARLLAVGKDDLFDSDISRSGTPMSRAGTPLPPKREIKGIATFTKKKLDDDIIASLDLDIDIDI